MKNKSNHPGKWGKYVLLTVIFLTMLNLPQPMFGAVQVIGSWVQGTTHAQEAGSNRALVFIAHARHGVTAMDLSAVTYGGQAMTKVIDCNAVYRGRIYTVAYILDEAGIAAATDSNFVLTWAGTPYATPSALAYSSVFLKNVNQDVLTEANGVKSNTVETTIALNSGLPTHNGDMVILSAIENGVTGSYTLNNDFIKGTDQALAGSGTADGVTGHKSGTGLPETPSATFNASPYCQALLGFVVSMTTDSNAPNNGSPANHATDVNINTNLIWDGGVGASYFDVYLGTDPNTRNNPIARAYSNSYQPPTELAFGTTYYWAVDSNVGGTIYSSDNWDFTTAFNNAANPNPANGDANIGLTPVLSWTSQRASSCDVYFGLDPNVRNNPKTTVLTNSYDPPGNLEIGLRYYWVVDVNDNGTIYPGDTWVFTTIQGVDPNYTIANWKGFCTSAVTYTFDDSYPQQFTIAIPIMDEPNFNYKGTFFTTTSPTWYLVEPDPGWDVVWAELQDAADNGHEIAAHGITHPYLNQLTLEQQRVELEGCQNDINAHITGQKCVTFANPYCVSGDQNLVSEYYIANRNCSDRMESNTPSNFYLINSMVCGTQSSLQTPADFNSKFEQTDAQGGWNIFLIHCFDDDTGYSPLLTTTFRSSLEYLSARRDRFWVDTFANVVKYIKERNDASIVETAHLDDSITLRVTTILDTSIFNYPITIRRPLPTGWLSAYVSQNGVPLDVSFEEIGSTTYAIFDAVPSGGSIEITKGLYGDFDGNGKVEYADLPDFVSYWLIEDCNETTAGIDLNADCRVNFHEFAALAENWLITP